MQHFLLPTQPFRQDSQSPAKLVPMVRQSTLFDSDFPPCGNAAGALCSDSSICTGGGVCTPAKYYYPEAVDDKSNQYWAVLDCPGGQCCDSTGGACSSDGAFTKAFNQNSGLDPRSAICPVGTVMQVSQSKFVEDAPPYTQVNGQLRCVDDSNFSGKNCDEFHISTHEGKCLRLPPTKTDINVDDYCMRGLYSRGGAGGCYNKQADGVTELTQTLLDVGELNPGWRMFCRNTVDIGVPQCGLAALDLVKPTNQQYYQPASLPGGTFTSHYPSTTSFSLCTDNGTCENTDMFYYNGVWTTDGQWQNPCTADSDCRTNKQMGNADFHCAPAPTYNSSFTTKYCQLP